MNGWIIAIGLVAVVELAWLIFQMADYWENLTEFLDKRDKIIINNAQRRRPQDFNRPGDI